MSVRTEVEAVPANPARGHPGGRTARLIQLDILRGVAILLVLGRHPVLEPRDAGVFRPLATLWHRFGWTGVDLFFVLSGFLVGGLLFHEIRKTGALDVRRFLIRRGLKIWPSYYLFLAFASAVVFAKATGPLARRATAVAREMWPSVLNVQNYFHMPHAHLWSLAVEEHFYLLLPLILLGVLAFARRGERSPLAAVPWIAVGLIVACTVWRCTVNAGRSYTAETHFIPTHIRIDGMMFGVLLAYWFREGAPRWLRTRPWRWALFASGVALIAPMLVLERERSPFVTGLGYTMLYLGYGAILVASLATPATASPSRPAVLLARIGLFSYPIYLWHMSLALSPVARVLRLEGGRVLPASLRWGIGTAFYVLLAIGAGTALSLLLEKPVLAFRDRLFPPRAAVAVEVEPTG